MAMLSHSQASLLTDRPATGGYRSRRQSRRHETESGVLFASKSSGINMMSVVGKDVFSDPTNNGTIDFRVRSGP